ncbi:TOMM precursor leader peptide-binding protein [Rhizobium sp. FY34]|uniref:TOMM precursor leader peptide-binding protein n=1 Tax=Rhizobium sp. FY34 TaxID=2562309 RepID=UPI0010C07401|nr:TOMM precursor leader peptide-binding protein [Rhizobium sp. FY34]
MTIELGAELDKRFRLIGVQAVAKDDGIILRRGRTRVFLAGDGLIEVLDRLVDDSLEGGISETRLKARMPPETWGMLEDVLQALSSRRLLVRADDMPGPSAAKAFETPEDIYYWELGTSSEQVHGRLADRQVPILGDNLISRHLLRMLHSCGVANAYLVDHPSFRSMNDVPADERCLTIDFAEWADSDRPDEADIFVVCSDFGGMTLMREWNEYCVGAGIAFFPVVLQDHVAYLGPIVTPDGSPCFECFWARQNSNIEDPANARATERSAFLGQHVNGYLPPMAYAAAEFAAMELVKYLTQLLPGGTIGTLTEIDLEAPLLQTRKVLKVPYCPVCSTAASHPMPAADHMVFMPGNSQTGH